MKSEDRRDLDPIITELMHLFDAESPGSPRRLAVQQAVSRAVFEAYRRGGRRARRVARESSLLEMQVVVVPDHEKE